MKLLDRLFFFNESGRYKEIEGLRAIAVLMVFNVHFFAQYSEKGYLMDDGFLRGLAAFMHAGHIGVDIFFVISGYLIWNIIFIKRRGRADYMLSRFERLYPQYFLVSFIHCFAGGFSILSCMKEVTFLPTILSAFKYRNFVSWSLGWEWQFYFFILLLSFFPAKMRKALLPAGAILALALILVPKPSWLSFPDFRFMNFFWGCALAEYKDKLKIGKALGYVCLPLLFGASLLWSMYSGAIQGNWLINVAFFLGVGLISALILANIVSGKPAYSAILSNKALRLVGQVSYTFYLVHALIGIPISNTILQNVDGPLTMAASYFLSLAVTLVISCILYVMVERNYFFVSLRPKVDKA
jgi:peptidoglycan/LPS O-acetylase OafA/YrhL